VSPQPLNPSRPRRGGSRRQSRRRHRPATGLARPVPIPHDPPPRRLPAADRAARL